MAVIPVFIIRMISILGVICGIFDIVIGFNKTFFLLGIAMIFLSTVLFNPRNIISGSKPFFSFIAIFLYLSLIFIWLISKCNPFWGGIIVVTLSIGLFKLNNISRITATIFSFLIVFLYIFLIFLYLMSNCHYGWGIGLVFYFPTLFWSILVIIFCNLPKVKSKFH